MALLAFLVFFSPSRIQHACMAALLCALPGLLAAEKAMGVPDFVELKPQPALLSLAQQVGGEIRPLDVDSARPRLEAGDAVTALVSLVEAGFEKQWLIDVEAVTSKPEERERGSGEPPHWFTNTGGEYVFSNAQSAMAIRTWGPFGGKTPPVVEPKQARVLVVSDFLGLGFDRQQALMLRLRQLREKSAERPKVSFSVHHGKRFEGVDFAKNRALLEERGLRAEDERAFVGTAPARLEFFMLAMRTPGLQELLRQVADIGWWSAAKSLTGVDIDFRETNDARAEDPLRWSLPAGTEVYSSSFLVVFNKRPILVSRIATTAPRPPLTASAGIVGMALCRPDGTGPRLYIQILGTRRAP